ncbi:MAG: hypothetical protein ACRD3S_16720, partial [Terracidiphilus sp.]
MSCAAQAPDAQPTIPYPVKPIPSDSAIPFKTKPLPQTLSDKHSPAATDHSIVYRSEGEMNADDRALAAKTQPAIREAAALAGMEFGNAQWSYRQLDCQAIPNHVFLIFESHQG